MKPEVKKEWQDLAKQMAEFAKLKPPAPPTAMAMTDVGPQAPPTLSAAQGRLAAQGARSVARLSLGHREAHRRPCTPAHRRNDDRPPQRVGRLADGGRQSADGARDGQSPLAAPFRPRHRGDAERLRRPGRAADASRTARLAGPRVRRERLEPEGDAPADGHLGDVSPGSRTTAEIAGRPIRTTRSLAA